MSLQFYNAISNTTVHSVLQINNCHHCGDVINLLMIATNNIHTIENMVINTKTAQYTKWSTVKTKTKKKPPQKKACNHCHIPAWMQISKYKDDRVLKTK